MTLHLTPDVLAAAYEYLRATQPFNRWRLPPADKVYFAAVNNPKVFGYYQRVYGGRKGEHAISVSKAMNGASSTLLRTIAHEMCHLRLRVLGRAKVHHGPAFQRLAAQVCRYHGFDPKEF